MSFSSGLFRDLRGSTDFIDSDELFVTSRLESSLDSREYRVLDNLLISSSGNVQTAQIDHLVLSIYGIFVIETKSHQGWIFGTTNRENWTQVLYRTKNPVYNPFWQNYSHTKAVEQLLGERIKVMPVSLVVFPSADKLIVNDATNIGTTQDVIDRILTHRKQIYTTQQVADMIKLISKHNMRDSAAHRQHAKDVSAYLQVV